MSFIRRLLNPTPTVLFVVAALAFGGAVITETVFAIPGVGRLMIDSIYSRDYLVVQGITLIFAIMVSIVFLFTDLIYAQLDPRVELS